MAQFSKAVWVKAVEMKCVECIYDPSGGNGTWREQVEGCTDETCPLYPVRPLPEGRKHETEALIPNLVERRREEWGVM